MIGKRGGDREWTRRGVASRLHDSRAMGPGPGRRPTAGGGAGATGRAGGRTRRSRAEAPTGAARQVPGGNGGGREPRRGLRATEGMAHVQDGSRRPWSGARDQPRTVSLHNFPPPRPTSGTYDLACGCWKPRLIQEIPRSAYAGSGALRRLRPVRPRAGGPSGAPGELKRSPQRTPWGCGWCGWRSPRLARRSRVKTTRATRSAPFADMGRPRTRGRYWDRTSDLFGVNEALSR